MSSNNNNRNSNTEPKNATTAAPTTTDSRGGIKFGTGISYDDAYASGINDSNDEFVTSLPTLEEERNMYDGGGGHDDYVKYREEMELADEGRVNSSHPSTLAAAAMSKNGSDDQGPEPSIDRYQLASIGGTGLVNTRISDRESEYHKRRHNRALREDGMSYKDAMLHANLDRERRELIDDAKKELLDENGNLKVGGSGSEGVNGSGGDGVMEDGKASRRRRRRWDDVESATSTHQDGVTVSEVPTSSHSVIVSDTESIAEMNKSNNKSRWDDDTAGSSSSRRKKRWDETPVIVSGSAATSSLAAPDATPLVNRNNWDETPIIHSGTVSATPLISTSSTSTLTTEGRKRSRWDSTPAPTTSQTPSSALTATPMIGSISGGTTLPISGALSKALSLEREMETRNRPWTDAALDAILPLEGYTILPPPTNYLPLRTPGRKLLATPTPLSMTPAGFQMAIPPEELQEGGASLNDLREAYGVPIGLSMEEGTPGALPFIKPEDMQYFGRLTEDADESSLSKEESNERKIMALLLKIKSGTPPQRKTAMRQITDKARSFGAGPLFNQILPLLMSPTLEDQERHLLVKVIDRILYKLEDLVRPFVHRILGVIQPLLIDEDYYARIEGREIISNLAKAAGLATMIATMRPDIDNPDEYVRNITSRAFAVVASALGVTALLPFLKAVCQSRKSWQARHTGIKIVQQIAVLMGCAVLPYLRELVDIVSNGLVDEQQKVRTIAALTVAALAEASYPYGIESFDPIIRSLWKGALEHYGKGLAAFLKAVGYVIPLMEENYASHYTRIVMPILLREFHSPDEEMKKIVLKVVKQCVATAGVEPEYIKKEILPEFFRNFWIRRMALDRRNHKQVVETTVELANKVGCSEIVERIVDDLKDDSEPYRRMVMETLQQVLENLGSGDIDIRLEERLIDGILYAFQEQAVDASLTGNNAFGNEGQIMLDGFGTVVNALGERCKPYLKQIAGTIKWRLNNKAPSVRMQAADLIGRIAVVMKACSEDQLMGHLGVVLYEYLGEEYPEVLGSILGALRAIINVIGMTKMTPPIRDLLPRLTPILRNRHEKVQENCIDLVGRIADRGAEFVSAKEWMRICFELLEMLKAHKKAIRRAAVSTFGYIAKAIGPQDVLHTLLNNLKVQDRQMRVCTTVAIAIVAETCGPFTVLPALMNEYRVPELNIQNGVLKALSFMFEYIGSMAKDYIYAVAPLLEDALMDRDPVHRQTGCATVKHLALGVAGLGCEDVLTHLLNYVWPNIFEESPHVIQAVLDAVQGLMVALGPNIILQYTLQGLFHPARKVRESYWKVYNILYIYNPEALVLGYPKLSSKKVKDTTGRDTVYTRPTMELFI